MNITWTWCETNLAMTINIIQSVLGELKGFPESPVSLSKRVSYIKKALSYFPVLHPLQEEGALLLKSVTHFSGRRNDFIHSASWQTQEGVFQTLNLRVVSGKYVASEKPINIDDAILLNIEIGDVIERSKVFMLKISELLSPKT